MLYTSSFNQVLGRNLSLGMWDEQGLTGGPFPNREMDGQRGQRLAHSHTVGPQLPDPLLSSFSEQCTGSRELGQPVQREADDPRRDKGPSPPAWTLTTVPARP